MAEILPFGKASEIDLKKANNGSKILENDQKERLWLEFSSREIVSFIVRVCEGYKPTPGEQMFLGEMRELDLSWTQINSLECLGYLKKLEKLWLVGTPLHSLKGLEALTNLQELNLSWTQIGSLKHLDNLKKLEKLWLVGTSVHSLKGLDALTNLVELNLRESQISSLYRLEGLTNLQRLYCSETQITSLKYINTLVNLLELDIRDTQVASLKSLENLKKLQAINLSGTRVTSLYRLSKLKYLEYLCIARISLRRIPQWLVNRKLPFKGDEEFGNEPGVYMKDVRLLKQPSNFFCKRSR